MRLLARRAVALAETLGPTPTLTGVVSDREGRRNARYEPKERTHG